MTTNENTNAIEIPMTPNGYNNGCLTTDHVIKMTDTNGRSKRYGIGAVPIGAAANKEMAGGRTERVSGPWAYAFGLCVVIDNNGGSGRESADRIAAGTEHVVTAGDHIIVDGVEYEIRPCAYGDDAELTPVADTK